MRVLLIGDIVGKPGRQIIVRCLPGLIQRERLDLVVANAENAAGGSGLTPAIYRELLAVGVGDAPFVGLDVGAVDVEGGDGVLEVGVGVERAQLGEVRHAGDDRRAILVGAHR